METEQALCLINECRAEAAKRIVGQSGLIDELLTALITGGHILLEGVPGIAKTLAVKTMADLTGLTFKRIQFTPDLLPADLTGTLIFEQQTGAFSVRKGPVFANVILADEINRAPAKVQSALLEAMAEYQVTLGETTYPLPQPFFVLATQNPVEQDGTYPLPEAQLDRFLMKVLIPYPLRKEEVEIMRSAGEREKTPVNAVLDVAHLGELRALFDQITCSDPVAEYIVSIVTATRSGGRGERAAAGKYDRENMRSDIFRYISYGASPRGSIALLKCAKAAALLAGRMFVMPEDVKTAAPSVLRHRIGLSYEAGADGLSADDIIAKILNAIAVP